MEYLQTYDNVSLNQRNIPNCIIKTQQSKQFHLYISFQHGTIYVPFSKIKLHEHLANENIKIQKISLKRKTYAFMKRSIVSNTFISGSDN